MIKSVRRRYDTFKKEETLIIELTPEFTKELPKLQATSGLGWKFWKELKEKLRG